MIHSVAVLGAGAVGSSVIWGISSLDDVELGAVSYTHLDVYKRQVFGGDGKHFFRMNLACPRERMMDGLKRLSQAITQIK